MNNETIGAALVLSLCVLILIILIGSWILAAALFGGEPDLIDRLSIAPPADVTKIALKPK